ncbi:MAG TPA: hypothetical protein VI076_07790 [Actinopolymorphaceae bacterium]
MPKFWQSPEEILRVQQEQIAKMAEVRARLAESPGRAETEDSKSNLGDIMDAAIGTTGDMAAIADKLRAFLPQSPPPPN